MVEASAKDPLKQERFQTLHGIALALFPALSSELILSPLMTPSASAFTSFGRMAVIFLGIYTVHRFSLACLQRYKPTFRDLATLMLVLLGTLFMMWAGRFLSISLAQYLSASLESTDVSPDAFAFAIPYAAGALLIQAVLGIHFGLVFSICLSIIVGVYSPGQTILPLFVLATCLTACLNLSSFRSRSAYIRAGFNLAIVSIPFALAATILHGGGELIDVILPPLGAVLGGVLCTFVAAGVTPAIEALGGYVTDMRLLEMATLDHPLLKELSIQAPGTWNHSMVMGMMVETAADAVGANTVLSRVGAYFHDIGKMKKPLYFVENQVPGDNRHDKLSSSMSALIIRSHVKDGLELGRKHKLPQPILDMIPEHHGTSLIEFFYDKACKEAKEAGEDPDEVDSSLYSYPGPKPQTREAGILMLADGIEAAARTLSEPNRDRIQGMVQKMINKVFASGQLNECDLTLNDLHRIAKSFTRILTSIYHQRIAYNEPVEKGAPRASSEAAQPEPLRESETMPPPRAETQEKKEREKESHQNGSAKVDSRSPEQPSREEDSEEKDDSKTKEDLKRLGI